MKKMLRLLALIATTVALMATGSGLASAAGPATDPGASRGHSINDGSWMEFYNESDRPVRIAKTYEDWANGKTTVLAPKSQESWSFSVKGYNQYWGTNYGNRWGSGRDAVAYLGDGYHMTAHNTGLGDNRFVVARYSKGGLQPKSDEKPLDHAGRQNFDDETIKFQALTFDLKFWGSQAGYKKWEVRIKKDERPNNTLSEGCGMRPGDSLTSVDGKTQLAFTEEDKKPGKRVQFIARHEGNEIWRSDRVFSRDWDMYAVMRNDGNLVYRNHTSGSEWLSGTGQARAKEGAPLFVRVADGGKIQIIGSKTGNVYWENGRHL